MRNCFTMMVKSVPLCSLHCHARFFFEWGENLADFEDKAQKEKGNILYLSKGNTILPLKNGFVPRDMLVLSIMTLSVDLLRQIATDPHGFSRAHSIVNGLFNFPQGALPFPCNASLKRHLLSVWSARQKYSANVVTITRNLSSPN